MAGKLFLLRRHTPMVGDPRETDAVLKGAAQYESRMAAGTPKVFDGVIRFCDATAKRALTHDGACLHASRPTRVAGLLSVGDGSALLARRPDVRQSERGPASASARIDVATGDL